MNGRCPIQDFLDSLNDKQVTRVLWILKLIKELDIVPKEYFKKLEGTDDIWEIRASSGRNNYRIFCFIASINLFVLTNGFAKKSQKIPKKEIQVAEQRRKDYLLRRK